MLTEEKVRNLIAEQMCIKSSEITLKTKFVTDLGVDSLDGVEIIMVMEDEFDIEIPDEDAEKILTVEELVNYIDNKKK